MNKTILIDSRDLHYTIDTYGMFTGESAEEGEREYLESEYGLTLEEVQNLEYNYNHAGVVKALATASVQLLHENFVQHGNGIVKEIELAKETSPQFYNYTTDAYTAFWTVEVDKLIEYVNTDINGFANHLTKIWNEFVNVPAKIDASFLENDADDKLLVAMIDFYTSREYDREDYEMSMFEYESEAWTENMTLTDESQKILDKKETK